MLSVANQGLQKSSAEPSGFFEGQPDCCHAEAFCQHSVVEPHDRQLLGHCDSRRPGAGQNTGRECIMMSHDDRRALLTSKEAGGGFLCQCDVVGDAARLIECTPHAVATQHHRRHIGFRTLRFAHIHDAAVVSTGNTGGGVGGEYPLQDGFGWTNGVTLKLLDLYGT